MLLKSPLCKSPALTIGVCLKNIPQTFTWSGAVFIKHPAFVVPSGQRWNTYEEPSKADLWNHIYFCPEKSLPGCSQATTDRHLLMAVSRAEQIYFTWVSFSDDMKDGKWIIFQAITHAIFPHAFYRARLRDYWVWWDCRRLLCFLSFLGHTRAV